MSPKNQAGFTLIEILVVIGIIGMLAAVLLPAIFGSQVRAAIAADKANMRWHYQNFQLYEQGQKRVPNGIGHRFIIDPWIKGIVQHTPENLDRYFIPKSVDTRKDELQEEDLEQIWRNLDDVTSSDTAYAGPGEQAKRMPQLLSNGKAPLMADDNEYGPTFADHTINVLLGDGNVREIRLDALQELGFDETVDGAVFEVGPNSPHPLLKLLEK